MHCKNRTANWKLPRRADAVVAWSLAGRSASCKASFALSHTGAATGVHQEFAVGSQLVKAETLANAVLGMGLRVWQKPSRQTDQ